MMTLEKGDQRSQGPTCCQAETVRLLQHLETLLSRSYNNHGSCQFGVCLNICQAYNCKSMLTDIRLVFSPSKSLKQTYQECLWVNQALVHLLQPRLTFLVGLVWTRDRTKIHICEGIEGNGPKVKGSDTITRIQLKINITYTLPLAYIHIGYIMSFNTGFEKEMIGDHPPAIL